VRVSVNYIISRVTQCCLNDVPTCVVRSTSDGISAALQSQLCPHADRTQLLISYVTEYEYLYQ